MSDHDYVDIVFDDFPGPEWCRFIEVEDSTGASIRLGEWVKRDDGYTVLRIPDPRVDGSAGRGWDPQERARQLDHLVMDELHAEVRRLRDENKQLSALAHRAVSAGERLQVDNERLRKDNAGLARSVAKLTQENTDLLLQVDRLRDALRSNGSDIRDE